MLKALRDSRLEHYRPEELAENVESFKQVLDNKDGSVQFFILRYDGKIAAFMYFKRLPNGNLYAGGLNVKEEAKGFGLGTIMLEKLQTKAEEINKDKENPGYKSKIQLPGLEKRPHPLV